jgi:hypothetical protein
LFGLGSTAGMALLTGVAGARLEHVSKHRRVPELLLGISGCISLLLGCYWAVSAYPALWLR